MQKRTLKKLALVKETVLRLEEDLAQIAGGATTLPGCITYTGIRTCASCDNHTCTSNRC
jgi:hypothetical protein